VNRQSSIVNRELKSL